MSIVSTAKKNAANPGDIISPAKANAIYNEIAASSAIIDNSNTRSDSISRRHLVDLSEQMTGLHPTFHQIQTKFQDNNSGVYSSTSYVDVSHGLGMIINFVVPVVLRPGEALRMQASLNMIKCTLGAEVGPGDVKLANQYYFFKFYGDPNGVSTALSPDYGYSMSSLPDVADNLYQNIVSSFSDKVQQKCIVQQREAFSYVYINKTSSPITFTNVRVKVRIQPPQGTCTQNTIEIKEYRIVALGVR